MVRGENVIDLSAKLISDSWPAAEVVGALGVRSVAKCISDWHLNKPRV